MKSPNLYSLAGLRKVGEGLRFDCGDNTVPSLFSRYFWGFRRFTTVAELHVMWWCHKTREIDMIYFIWYNMIFIH